MSAGADWMDHAHRASLHRARKASKVSPSAIEAWNAALRPRPEIDGNRHDEARVNALLDAAADEIGAGE